MQVTAQSLSKKKNRLSLINNTFKSIVSGVCQPQRALLSHTQGIFPWQWARQPGQGSPPKRSFDYWVVALLVAPPPATQATLEGQIAPPANPPSPVGDMLPPEPFTAPQASPKVQNSLSPAGAQNRPQASPELWLALQTGSEFQASSRQGLSHMPPTLASWALGPTPKASCLSKKGNARGRAVHSAKIATLFPCRCSTH